MKKYLFLLLLTMPYVGFSQNTDYTLHQRIWNTTGTFDDQMGQYTFPYLDSAKFGIGGIYENIHFSGIQNVNISVAARLKGVTVSLSSSSISAPSYNQLSAHLATTLLLGKQVRLGASLDYMNVSVPTFSQQSAIDASLGTQVKFTDDIRIEMLATHLFELLQSEDTWDSYLILRSLYDVSPNATLCFSAEKNKTHEMSGRLMIDYHPHRLWSVLVGYQFRPNLFTIGLEFSPSQFRIGLLTSTHTQLHNSASVKAQYVK